MTERNTMESTFSPVKYETLRLSVVDNIEHFRKFEGKYSSKLLEIFSQFLDCVNAVEIEITDLSAIVHLYDLDADTPANGYRSIISIVCTFLEISTGICQEVIFKRGNLNFSIKRHFRDVRLVTEILSGLLTLLRISQKIRAKNEPGVLWSLYDDDFVRLIITDIESVDRRWFYGKLFAFQFNKSLRKSLRFVCLAAAAYSHSFYNSGGKFPRICSAIVNFCRYSNSSSKLSNRFVTVSYNAQVDFCKTFWNLEEMDFLAKLAKTRDSLAVNKRINLLPKPLQLTKDDGTIVDIPIPSSHIPVSSVMCRLVSFTAREGQMEETESVQRQIPHAMKAASPYLIIHIHGSGFVSVSSTIHKVYLNEWAESLDAPILSIYHSLAPEAPYPRALEECLYAYAWAIKNCHRLGSTCEKICLVGCSAGGDLVTSLTIKAIQLGIRIPDGVISVCPTITAKIMPSPSALLCTIDPIVPMGFVLSCVEAYTGDPCRSERKYADRSLKNASEIYSRVAQVNKNASNDDPLKSPVLASDEILAYFPPTIFVSTHLDPFLDYVVTFVKRMKALGRDGRLELMGNLVHGFLNFALVNEPASEGSRLCIQRIRDLLQMHPHHGIS